MSRKYLLLSEDYYPPQVGGISTMMDTVRAALGAEQVVVLTSVSQAEGEDARGPSIVHRDPHGYRADTLAGEVRLMLKLLWLVCVHRPHLVIAATTADAVIALRLRKLLRIPFIVFAHGNEILGALKQRWEKPREALRSAAVVIANSNYTASLIRGQLADPENVAVVHPVCRLEHFRAVEDRAASRRRLIGEDTVRGRLLLTVGNLVPRKGHDAVIRCLPELRKRFPDLVYVIAGDGPHRPHLESLAERLGVLPLVRFLGRVPEENLAPLYAASDVFIMVSSECRDSNNVEGFGIVYLEAGACGVPVIAGTDGGVPDAVVDGETGILVDPKDSAGLQEAITRLLGNPAEACLMGERGRRRANGEFSVEAMTDKLNSLLVERGLC
jgi:phosphatidylinositol alpha-1,6-mannosyltransferase